MIAKLPFQHGDHTATRTQHISESDGNATHAVSWTRRQNQFADSFSCTHDVGWVYSFVRGNQHKVLAAGLFSQAQQAPQGKYIVLNRLWNVGLHHGHMLVRSRMEDDLRS